MVPSRKTRIWLGIGFVALAVAALTGLYLTGPSRWLGASAVAVLSDPTRVETYKLDGLNKQPEDAPNTIGGYAIVTRGRLISGVNAVRLGHSLLSAEDYVFGNFDPGSYHVSPGVGLRFWKDGQSVDVAVCFLCGHVLMDTRDDRGRTVYRYFAPFPFQRLAGFGRKSFPNDPQMQDALSTYERREMMHPSQREPARPARR